MVSERASLGLFLDRAKYGVRSREFDLDIKRVFQRYSYGPPRSLVEALDYMPVEFWEPILVLLSRLLLRSILISNTAKNLNDLVGHSECPKSKLPYEYSAEVL